ncbi:LPXTG cell wall anchor domain-containing protein, partial [Gracilibacillus sp. JCM 18860]
DPANDTEEQVNPDPNPSDQDSGYSEAGENNDNHTELPNTSTNIFNLILTGLGAILLGIATSLFARRNKTE